MTARSGTVWLVGDIGATNARFGLVSPDGAIVHSSTFADTDFATIGDAVRGYLTQSGRAATPRIGCLAIAAPVGGDEIRMTNHPWSFSVGGLRDELGFDRLEIINDFAAVALALPRLKPNDRIPVGGGAPVAGRPIAILGPGSGLGASGLIPVGRSWLPLTGEGGHARMPAATEREDAVLAWMRRHFDHVSAERCLSGPGLVNLYSALAELDGAPAASYAAAQITDPAIGAQDPLCREATAMFCAMLGTVAGDLALTLGAQGGVFIAGGIVPRLGARFIESGFRARFEAKGRLSSYVAAIPTYVVTHSLPAFLGCAAVLAAT
ncbi:MAG: glucokinase [Alphaproteobacteria bacterium]|nr:glucokinase [Alphaproteobacteria bacterium]